MFSVTLCRYGGTRVFANSRLISICGKPLRVPFVPHQRPTIVLARYSSTQLPPRSSPPPTAPSVISLFSLAYPERVPLSISLTLLLFSSSVTMSVPFSIGKLIDFFSSSDPVRFPSFKDVFLTRFSKALPFGLSPTTATALLVGAFTVGAAANAGRAILIKISGGSRVQRDLIRGTKSEFSRSTYHCASSPANIFRCLKARGRVRRTR
jgi:hypothetical protein